VNGGLLDMLQLRIISQAMNVAWASSAVFAPWEPIRRHPGVMVDLESTLCEIACRETKQGLSRPSAEEVYRYAFDLIETGHSRIGSDLPRIDIEQIPPGRWFQDVIQSIIPRSSLSQP
jgi:hypothetical protein